MADLWRPLLVVGTLVAILVLIVLSVFSCGSGDENSQTAAKSGAPASAPGAPEPDSGEATDEGGLAAVDLKVGDCVGDARSTVGDVTTFHAVGCDEAHDGEIYTLIVLPGAEGSKYPGEKFVTAKGQRGCRARLRRQATARAFRDPQLGFKFVYPTALSWADGDRRIRCMATFKKPRSKSLAQR
jgi:hypothetical protein